MATLVDAGVSPTDPPAPSRRFRPRASASGHRLFGAFAALEALPALAHSHAQLQELLRDEDGPRGEIVATIESDAALATAVLRAAAERCGDPNATTDVNAALGVLTRGEMQAAVAQLPLFDFFDRGSLLAVHAGRLRVHALATQAAVRRVREELDLPPSGFLSVAALFHDIGKVVLAHAYEHYGELLEVPEHPDEWLRLERETLGIDHTIAGGVLIRRLRLSNDLASAVEHHHSATEGDAAMIRLADMIAHYAAGQPVDAAALSHAGSAAGLDGTALRRVLAEPTGGRSAHAAASEPCPLSHRQLEIIRMLRAGKVYKQIAGELNLAESTVRTHLHLAYEKMGVVDRAQAVLLASSRGWI